jgi:hypothetical protein
VGTFCFALCEGLAFFVVMSLELIFDKAIRTGTFNAMFCRLCYCIVLTVVAAMPR